MNWIEKLYNRIVGVQADILSDATPFPGGDIDATISSRATQADILTDATPFPGADIDTTISSRAIPGDQMALTAAEELIIQGLILTDTTPFPGANVDAAISSAVSAPAAALAADAYVRQAGVAQIKPTTIDLNQAAATYDLFTGTAQDVIVEALVIRMSGGAIAGAVTSISIQTDDTTPQVFINTTDGAVANLTDQAQLSWENAGIVVILKAGKKIQLTIAGGAAGVARVCDVVCKYRAATSGGYLA
jgi:hypothetical protein